MYMGLQWKWGCKYKSLFHDLSVVECTVPLYMNTEMPISVKLSLSISQVNLLRYWLPVCWYVSSLGLDPPLSSRTVTSVETLISWFYTCPNLRKSCGRIVLLASMMARLALWLFNVQYCSYEVIELLLAIFLIQCQGVVR